MPTDGLGLPGAAGNLLEAAGEGLVGLLIEADFPWPMFFEAPFTALPGITTALCINNAYLIDIIPAKALAQSG